MGKFSFRQVLSSFKKTPSIFRKVYFFTKILIVIIILSSAGLTFWSVDYLKSPGPLATKTTIVIPQGSFLKSISRQLSQENIIKYPEIFTGIIRIISSNNHLKAGQYEFAPNISPIQVFYKLQSGNVVMHKLTIPEGLMTSQILEIISNAKFMSGEVPKDINEGELLPETYDYYYGDSRKKLVNRMRKAMRKVLYQAWENRVSSLPIKTPEEALILASIVEKETGISSERDRVAAVFVNRLIKGMRLQTDPTVIYAITDGKYVLPRPLLLKDLEIVSPYNTYKNYGLPPTPISNPGKAAIKATLSPATTNEYYFVADGTGGHKFSSTLKEHNKNVRKWRRINGRK